MFNTPKMKLPEKHTEVKKLMIKTVNFTVL